MGAEVRGGDNGAGRHSRAERKFFKLILVKIERNSLYLKENFFLILWMRSPSEARQNFWEILPKWIWIPEPSEARRGEIFWVNFCKKSLDFIAVYQILNDSLWPKWVIMGQKFDPTRPWVVGHGSDEQLCAYNDI